MISSEDDRARLYEVNASVDAGLTEEYERYMIDRHIPDVLATGCFAGAWLLKSGETSYRIVYEVSDEDTLRRYIDEHAPALRADFAAHFPTGVSLSREIWSVEQRWPSAPRSS